MNLKYNRMKKLTTGTKNRSPKAPLKPALENTFQPANPIMNQMTIATT